MADILAILISGVQISCKVLPLEKKNVFGNTMKMHSIHKFCEYCGLHVAYILHIVGTTEIFHFCGRSIRGALCEMDMFLAKQMTTLFREQNPQMVGEAITGIQEND